MVWLHPIVSEMTYNVSMGTLNPTIPIPIGCIHWVNLILHKPRTYSRYELTASKRRFYHRYIAMHRAQKYDKAQIEQLVTQARNVCAGLRQTRDVIMQCDQLLNLGFLSAITNISSTKWYVTV